MNKITNPRSWAYQQGFRRSDYVVIGQSVIQRYYAKGKHVFSVKTEFKAIL